MSDLFILDARNVFKTLFEYRRAVLLKNHRKKSRKRRCYLVLLFLTDVKVTSFLGASLSLGRLSSSPPPVALFSLPTRAAAVTTAASETIRVSRLAGYSRLVFEGRVFCAVSQSRGYYRTQSSQFDTFLISSIQTHFNQAESRGTDRTFDSFLT